MADYRENVLPVVTDRFITSGLRNRQLLDFVQIYKDHQVFGVQMATDTFVGTTYMLMDAMAPVTILSQFFQTENIDIALVKKSSSLREVLASVRKMINYGNDRLQGVVLLSQIVHQCNTDVFTSNVSTWLQLLLQTLQTEVSVTILQLTCCVCSDILSHAQNVTSVIREITTIVLPQLMAALLAAAPEWRDSALACINTCVQTYPGSCGPFKARIEAVVIAELDQCQTSDEAVRSYGLLAQCGGSGSAGVKHTEGWTRQFDRLMTTLQDTLHSLYDGLDTGFSRPTLPGLPLTRIEDSSPDRVPRLVQRWTVLTRCLNHLLGETFPAVVRVPIETVLHLVSRCLGVNNNILLTRPTTERSLLALYLPMVHSAGLKCLEHLILGCRSAVLPHCPLVNSLLSQELTWTSVSESFGHDKPHSSLRVTVYEVMASWARVLGSSCSIVTEEKTIIKQILLDTQLQTNMLKLEISGDVGKAGGTQPAKKKHGGYEEAKQGISLQRKLGHHANRDLVIAALDALYWILTSCGTELSSKSLQSIQKFAVGALLSLQRTGDTLPAPYSAAGCRRALYRVLQGCVLVPHPSTPPPIQGAIGIFSIGQQDVNLEVASMCMEASRLCESLIHPRVPCLNGPVVCVSLVEVDMKPTVNQVRELSASQPVSGGAGEPGTNVNLPVATSQGVHVNGHGNDRLGTDASSQTENAGSESLASDVINLASSPDVIEVESVQSKETSRKRPHSSDEAEIACLACPKVVRLDSEPGTSQTGSSVVSSTEQTGPVLVLSDGESDSDIVVSGSEEGEVTHDTVLQRSQTGSTVGADCPSSTVTEAGTQPGSGEQTLQVSSDEESKEGENSDEVNQRPAADNEKAPDKEVEAMLLTFVDAGPDSD